MKLHSSHALLPLSARRPQRLRAARGLTLRARSGALWITIDHDPRDIVLRPGEQWVVDSDEPLIVSPLGQGATLELCEQQAMRRQRQAAWWRDTLDALWDRDGRNGAAHVSPAATVARRPAPRLGSFLWALS